MQWIAEDQGRLGETSLSNEERDKLEKDLKKWEGNIQYNTKRIIEIEKEIKEREDAIVQLKRK